MSAIAFAKEIISKELLEESSDLFAKNNLRKPINTWQFRTQEKTCFAITARLNDQLIGYNATMPIIFQTDNEKYINAVWSCDFIVDYPFRGQSIGKKIKTYLAASFDGPILALGISKSALQVHGKQNWQKGPNLPLYRKLIRPVSSKEKLFWLCSNAVRILSRRKYFNDNKGITSISKTCPESIEISNLWSTVKQTYKNCIVRDASYFCWRYAGDISTNYRFVNYNENNTLKAVLVFRVKNCTLYIIDYLGDLYDLAAFFQCLKICETIKDVSTISVMFSNKNIKNLLATSGYLPTRTNSHFSYFSNSVNANFDNTFLSYGDSDGELLKAYSDKDEGLSPSIHYRTLTEYEFSSCAKEWQNLLKQCNANPLFMSWQWQHTWWQTWEKTLKSKANINLTIMTFYCEDELIGILPLYKNKKKYLGVEFDEYQFLGNAFKIMPTVRSEYIQPLFHKSYTASLYKAFSNWLSALPKNSILYWQDNAAVDIDIYFKNCLLLHDVGVKIPTNQDEYFDYVKLLGKNTKLKAISRQNLLAKEYPNHQWSRFSNNEKDCDKFFELLNSMHLQRWGKECFDAKAITFHKQLILEQNSIEADMKYLEVNNSIIAVLYNLRAKETVYNIQSGFITNFDGKYSLGTMTLMHSIQECFQNKSIKYFDMLAGRGMKTRYKSHFRGESKVMSTHVIFSSSKRKYIYQSYLILKSILAAIREKYLKNRG